MRRGGGRSSTERRCLDCGGGGGGWMADCTPRTLLFVNGWCGGFLVQVWSGRGACLLLLLLLPSHAFFLCVYNIENYSAVCGAAAAAGAPPNVLFPNPAKLNWASQARTSRRKQRRKRDRVRRLGPFAMPPSPAFSLAGFPPPASPRSTHHASASIEKPTCNNGCVCGVLKVAKTGWQGAG